MESARVVGIPEMTSELSVDIAMHNNIQMVMCVYCRIFAMTGVNLRARLAYLVRASPRYTNIRESSIATLLCHHPCENTEFFRCLGRIVSDITK